MLPKSWIPLFHEDHTGGKIENGASKRLRHRQQLSEARSQVFCKAHGIQIIQIVT